ncbi:ROK family protein [Bogoriella caseilytica]|uniref:Putative NBD/HSP70 family sugar kinase n=1 Tax=Bogoriella caseilytica TaxID=56055 RepID=A0A3N2BDH6_9MICO|nr:ROK family protein [Bogoriella caseilytica]ROR73313.1 putative NBD/HSP70 family sugar kinase [Bogoriella caseilytica]
MSPVRVDPARQQRLTNATGVLHAAWSQESFTASDLIEATGLTRSTVLGLCAELLDLGWIHELTDTRVAGQYSKGRPARRYAFHPHAGHVIGVDAGQHRITASVADLNGSILATAEDVDAESDVAPQHRRERVMETIQAALAASAEPAAPVLALVIGVPAPVDDAGLSPEGARGYWARMNPGLAGAGAELAQRVLVENDANLAAVAEGAIGAGRGLRCFAALLSGERFGTGLIADGELIRGHAGGAGEMRLLDLVEGVGSTNGLGHLARELVGEAIAAGTVPASSTLPGRLAAGESPPDAVAVFAAARAGDEFASSLVDQLADRLARVCAVLAALFDPERIVVSGAIATSLGHLVEVATERLTDYAQHPVPSIVASTLGADVVQAGALHRALGVVRADPLAFDVAR